MALSGQVQIDHGGVEAVMTQVLLDAADIDAGLQQMGGIAMAQGVDGDAFFKFKLFQYPAQGALNGGFVHWDGGGRPFFAAAAEPREDPDWISMQLPVRS